MSVILDAVAAYKSGQIDFNQVREQVRQVKSKPRPTSGNPWLYNDDPDIEDTSVEILAAALMYDLTADEYDQLLYSLDRAPVGAQVGAQQEGQGQESDALRPLSLAEWLAPLEDEETEEIMKGEWVPGPNAMWQKTGEVGTGGGGKEGDDDTHAARAKAPTGEDAADIATARGGSRAERPGSMSEMIGQDKVRDRLGIMMDAAKKRGAPLDHILFTGPPGLGKTTFARAIAKDMTGRDPIIITGSALNKDTLVSLLGRLEEGDVLFIDEIHAMPKGLQEMLFPVMEDFEADLELDGQRIRAQLPQFTLIGATTNPEGLSQPLRDRFGDIEQLDFYEDKPLTDMAMRTASKMNIDLPPDTAAEIAMRSRGTPRMANRMVRRLSDYATATNQPLTPQVADEALDKWDIDSAGLTSDDRKVLSALSETRGAPTGLNTLSSYTGFSPDTIGGAIEPYLLRKGFIRKTPQGRIITEKGLAHLDSLAEKAPAEVVKAADDQWIEVKKLDKRRNMIFGWASMAFEDGSQITDHQGHLIDLDDLEDAAYNYVIKFRTTGDMHQGDSLGEMVESLVVTEDKVEKGGFPRSMLGHWWVGFKIPPEHFDKIEKGERLMFSIQGRAQLEPLPD